MAYTDLPVAPVTIADGILKVVNYFIILHYQAKLNGMVGYHITISRVNSYILMITSKSGCSHCGHDKV
jgi:hypothetical protein